MLSWLKSETNFSSFPGFSCRGLLFFKRLFSFLFPTFCSVCGRRILGSEGICEKCARSVDGPIIVRDAPSHSAHLDMVHHFWWYEGVVERVIKLYKYSDRVKLRHVLASWIFKTLTYFNLLNLPITWVPSNYSALKTRGFETMKEVAYELRKMGLEVYEFLDCVGNVPPQVGLSFRERMSKVKGKYRVLKPPPPKIVIIDDVYTTGATLNECARVMKSAGAKHVVGITVARVKM